MKALLLCVALVLAGCATKPASPADPRKIWCETNEPRRDATPASPRWVIDEINAQNFKGEQWCGWKP